MTGDATVAALERFIPSHDVLDHAYRDLLAAGEFCLRRCRACQAWDAPAASICCACGSARLAWEAVSKEGHVVAATMVHRCAVPPFNALVPYVTAIIELQGGVRMLGYMPSQRVVPPVGTEVRARIQATPSSAIVLFDCVETAERASP